MVALWQKQEADLQTLCQKNMVIQAQLLQSQANTQQTVPAHNIAKKRRALFTWHQLSYKHSWTIPSKISGSSSRVTSSTSFCWQNPWCPPSLWMKPLDIDRYDGTIFPNELLKMYIMQVNWYTNNNVILCRVFPISLKGPALTWWHQLLLRSTDSFDTLFECFGTQYAICWPHHTTSMTLINLQQADNESLCHLMAWFS